MRPALVSIAPLALSAGLQLFACGSPEAGTTSGDSGDGKYHPAGNGQRESEAAACNALSNAQDAANTAMMCIATSRPCPTLIEVQVGGTACLQYDQGSVQGCVDYFDKQTSCDALATAVNDCVVTAFPGSAPMGCP